MTTELEEAKKAEIADKFYVTRQKVDDFRIPTQDDNKIHQEGRPIALGFQLKALLRDYVDSQHQNIPQGWVSAIDETTFRDTVSIDTKLEPKIVSVVQAGKILTIDAKLTKKGQKDPAVEGTFTYQPVQDLPVIQENNNGNAYWLTLHDAEQISRSLSKEQPDFSNLARGLASNVLYTRGRVLVEKATEQGLVAAYVKHKIQNFRSYIGKSADDVLRDGISIILSTDAEVTSQRLVEDIAKQRDTKKRFYSVNVTGTAADGLIIYRAKLTLGFTTPDQLHKNE